MKNLLKTLSKTKSKDYLCEKFSRLSKAKPKESIFVGPQIHGNFRDDTFDHLLSGDKEKAWKSFQLVATKFHRNYRAEKYENRVASLLRSYKALGRNILSAFPFRFLSIVLWRNS